MKDFNFHTAHLKYTLSKILVETLGDNGKKAVDLALKDYTEAFGEEYLTVLNGIDPGLF